MADIMQTTFSNAFSWLEISLNFTEIVPKGPIDYKPVLVQVMACGWRGDKWLSEPVIAWFTEACILYWAVVS